MLFEALLKSISYKAGGDVTSVDITGLQYDSRKVQTGDLFFALPGTKTDGNAFISQAIEKGAVAIVCEQTHQSGNIPTAIVQDARRAMAIISAIFFGHPSRRLKIAGVTGTNGKTTTTFLIKHLYDSIHKRTGLIGTIRYAIAETLLPAPHTTPEAVDLQGLLQNMIDAGCHACAMEVSSHALAQHRADCIDFDTAIFTNLTQDHLDYHETMAAYFAAKQRLFDLLCENENKKGRAIVNCDDRYGRRIIEQVERHRTVVRYGLGAGADFRATNIHMETSGTTFRLQAKGREYLVRSPFIGTFNVYNVLAALAAVSAMGVEVRAAVAAIANAPQVPGRLERVPAKRNFQVFVDYAHTPDALQNVLRTVKDLNPKRIITVFGCGGDRDRTKRAPMAEVAEAFSDKIIVTNDNPRSEDPEQILTQITAGLKRPGYIVEPDRARAIEHAVTDAEPGDIVLIAGKGHENYQEILGHRSPFDDVQVAKSAINQKPAFDL